MDLFKPPTVQQAADQLDAYLSKIKTRASTRPLQVRVYSDQLGLDYSFPSASGAWPYHLASIGKVFTAVLVYRLAARGQLDVHDLIADHLSPQVLQGLFVFQGVDHAGQVRIEHLLAHTSGAADYFEGRTAGGPSFISRVLRQPDTHWTPQTLLDFVRAEQAAVGIPGQVFNYSDTGYILLGLIVEKVTGGSLAHRLAEEIFLPLDMRDSYLMFHGKPVNSGREIEPIWFDGLEISRFASLSCDWAGGGIVSTTADLLKFSQALRSGRLVSPAALASMDSCTHRFRPGIYYGQGMMELRFKEFFFLLGHLPRVRGHIGILSTHLFYDPVRDAHIIMNFGDNTRMVESFRALITIETLLHRLRPQAPA